MRAACVITAHLHLRSGASVAPSVSALVEHGDIEPRAVKQLETFAAAVQFSKAEGIIPAPESAHAIRVAIDEALKCKVTGEKKVIAFNLSGHGHFDTPALAFRCKCDGV